MLTSTNLVTDLQNLRLDSGIDDADLTDDATLSDVGGVSRDADLIVHLASGDTFQLMVVQPAYADDGYDDPSEHLYDYERGAA